jgi:type IV pilus assembly protein PilO
MMNLSDISQQWRKRMQQHPASWPKSAQWSLFLLCFVMPLLIAWQAYLASSLATLQKHRQHEQRQQELYQQKWPQAALLPALQEQKKRLMQHLEQRQQQLFDNDDSSSLIGEVSSLAADCHLALEHARPGTPDRQSSHTVLPLHLRLRGGYHAMGCLAAAMAASSRALTLADLQLSRSAEEQFQLALEATLLTYRQHPSEQQP